MAMFTARLAGAPDLPPTLRTLLEARFRWEIERLYGSDEAAAASLHHWEDDGGEIVEPLPWAQATERVTAMLQQDAGMPAGSEFRCELTPAFFRPRPSGAASSPLYEVSFVSLETPALSAERGARLCAQVRQEINRQFDGEEAAAGALHAQDDAGEDGNEPLMWCEAAAIAERIVLTNAGMLRSEARFIYKLNFDAMFGQAEPAVWPTPAHPTPF